MALQSSSTLRREMIYQAHDLPLHKHARNTKKDRAIGKESRLATDVEYEPFRRTTSAYAKGESSPATFSVVWIAIHNSCVVRNSAMKPQRSSVRRLERVCLEQGPSPKEYARNAKKAPSV